MRITKRNQKTALLSWIAEGLSSGEIEQKATAFKPPFSVSRSQVDYYRKTRATDFKALSAISEKTAMTEGFAIKEHRVYKLSLLAALLEKDLFGGILWTSEVKGIGGAENFEVIEYEEFNKAEVDAYRGVLDDIAAEMSDRKKAVDLTSGGKSLVTDYKIFNLDELLRIKNGESETVVYADALQRLATSKSGG